MLCGCTINLDINGSNKNDTIGGQVNNTEQNQNIDMQVNKNRFVSQNYDFSEVQASSQLANQGKYNYSPYNVTDGDVKTAWVEGVVGRGENEWIQLSSNKTEIIHKIGICNGYRQSNKVFTENGRVNSAMLEFSDGSNMTVNFDTVDADGFTYFNIGNVETSYVRVTLLSCIGGSKYNDTCISEIKIY